MNKGKTLSLLAITLLLTNNNEQLSMGLQAVEAFKLAEQASMHSHAQLHHRKNEHKKKHQKKQKKEESESESSDSSEEEESPKKATAAMVQQSNSEGVAITEKANEGLKQFKAEDATIEDMYAFSKVIANGKTANEALKEEQDKLVKMQAIAKKENEERLE